MNTLTNLYEDKSKEPSSSKDLEESECQKQLIDIHDLLHSLVLWSHIIFLIGGAYALFTKQYILGFGLLFEMIISFIYHSDESSQFFATSDFYTASILAVITVVIAYQKIVKLQKNRKDGKELHTLYISITLAIIAFTAYILAEHTAPQTGAYDTDKGIYADFTGKKVDDDDTPITKEKSEIMYLIYHTIWHIVIGIIAIIIISI